MLCKRLTCS
jgi:MFS family permease